MHDIQVSDFYARYHNSTGQTNQTDTSEYVYVDLKNQFTFRAAGSTTGVQIVDGEFLPFNGNAVLLGYRMNASTPTYVRHAGGSYYHG